MTLPRHIFDDLVLLNVFRYLPANEVAQSLSLVSKRWRRLAHSSRHAALWSLRNYTDSLLGRVPDLVMMGQAHDVTPADVQQWIAEGRAAFLIEALTKTAHLQKGRLDAYIVQSLDAETISAIESAVAAFATALASVAQHKHDE